MSVSPTFNHKQKVWTLSLHIYLNSLFADYFKNNSFGDAQIVIWGGGSGLEIRDAVILHSYIKLVIY